MKVTLESPYGIGAAFSRVVADTERLSSEEAAALVRLAAAARAEKQGASGGSAQDTIRIEDAGATVDLAQPVTGMSPAFAALRSWVREHGQRQST